MVQRTSTSAQALPRHRAAGASRRRRAHYLALGLVLCDLVAPAPALAQTTAPQTTAPQTTAPGAATGAGARAATTPAAASISGQAAPGKITSVNVVGERPTNRIDRQVYDNKQDASSSNGSAADALGNVPSVAVDPDGTVSLRGSTNVQILVDGKPSAMLQGDNRGAALQAMPSEDIDSIEVINNPGAEFGNEGGGGPILNLVMKRSRRPGGFGVANANAGTKGRYNAALNGQYNTGRWGAQGGMNVRHDGRNQTYETQRDRIDPLTGAVQHTFQTQTRTDPRDSVGLRGQLSYNLGQDDTLEASAAYMKVQNHFNILDHFALATNGVLSRDYQRTTRSETDNSNSQLGAHWDHKGEKLGELFRMDLRVSGSDSEADSRYANTYLVAPFPGLDASSLQDRATRVRIVDYTGDYERPLDSGGILKVGYKLIDTDSRFDTRYLDVDRLTGAGIPNGRRSNAFDVDERDAAVYASYQWKLSERWGALLGMRTEYTHMDLDQVTAGVNTSNRYVNWIPSAYATYKLDPATNLRFAYAHRIRRATANDLNPFVLYLDELNESSGNPRLKPVQTDSFEAGYETRAGKLDANLRAYYRADRDMIRSRQVALADNVLLTTRENGGSNRAGGLEFTLNGKITPTLSVNASGNLAFTEQQQIDLLGAEFKRSATSLSVRGRLSYQPTPEDTLQLTLHAQGKTLAGTGYREPMSTMNFTYRRAITPALSLVFNLNDAFSSQKIETVTDTAILKQHAIRRFDGRMAYLGLSYRFGGVQGSPRGGREGDREGGRAGGEGWHGGPPPGGAPGGFGGPGT